MKTYISKKEFNYMLLDLMTKLNPYMDDFDCVLGILNGGYNLSSRISVFYRKLHLKLGISFYDGDVKLTHPNITNLHILERIKDFKFKKILWVDDIVDSGSTLQWFIDHTGLVKGKDFSVATLHWCPENSPNLEPEFYVDIKKKTDWLVYHWEIS